MGQDQYGENLYFSYIFLDTELVWTYYRNIQSAAKFFW